MKMRLHVKIQSLQALFQRQKQDNVYAGTVETLVDTYSLLCGRDALYGLSIDR